MQDPATTLHALLAPAHPDAGAVRALLDDLDHAGRMLAITSLAGPALQGRLYETVAHAPVVTREELVPPDLPSLREVIWHGKNSLPLFTRFQKRFCRPDGARGAQELWGYNHQPNAWVTGPGYFVVHEEAGAPAAIDYRLVPPAAPPGWPQVKVNDRGLSRFVYAGMVDYLRRVSRHVLIGRAHRRGTPLPNYFILCREP